MLLEIKKLLGGKPLKLEQVPTTFVENTDGLLFSKLL